MIFELVRDFADALEAMPTDHPRHRLLKLLDEAIRRDIHFIARHREDYPQALFQCAWNNGWWYDCPEAEAFNSCDWRRSELTSPKLHVVFERWDAMAATRGTKWLRARMPPPTPIGSLLAVVLRGHEKSVKCLAYSPDGRWLASGSSDNTVRIWDAFTGELVSLLCGHNDIVYTVAFSPDGCRIASGTGDGIVRILDVFSGAELHVLRGHMRTIVWSVAFSPDGAWIASGSEDDTVCVWEAPTGTLIKKLRGHTNSVSSVAFSPDSKQIVSGSYDGTIRLWDSNSGSELRQFMGDKKQVWAVIFSSDGTRLGSGSDDGNVSIWDIGTGNKLPVQTSNSCAVRNMVFINDGTQLISQSGLAISIADCRSGSELRGINFLTLRSGLSGLSGMAVSFDGATIAIGIDDFVVLLDLHSGDNELPSYGHRLDIMSICLSLDGSRLASGSWDNTVRIWDTMNGTELFVLRGHDTVVTNVRFSIDGRRIISESHDGAILIWDVSNGKLISNNEKYDADDLADVDLADVTERVRRCNWKPRRQKQEAVVLNEKYQRIAWFAEPLQEIAIHPPGRIWAGANGSRLFLLNLEGVNSASGTETS